MNGCDHRDIGGSKTRGLARNGFLQVPHQRQAATAARLVQSCVAPPALKTVQRHGEYSTVTFAIQYSGMYGRIQHSGMYCRIQYSLVENTETRDHGGRGTLYR